MLPYTKPLDRIGKEVIIGRITEGHREAQRATKPPHPAQNPLCLPFPKGEECASGDKGVGNRVIFIWSLNGDEAER